MEAPALNHLATRFPEVFDDLLHYQKIVVALRETMRLMDEIDDAIPTWPIA